MGIQIREMEKVEKEHGTIVNKNKTSMKENVKIKKKANHASSTTPIGGKTETVVMKRMQFTLAL